jgi:hypothetical protein
MCVLESGLCLLCVHSSPITDQHKYTHPWKRQYTDDMCFTQYALGIVDTWGGGGGGTYQGCMASHEAAQT